ncbi:MAG TPA: hypothetical protein VF858_11340, partial [Gemmatimonadaceae bacterium]
LGFPVSKLAARRGAHGQRARAVTDLDWEARGVLVGGASRSKRLAPVVVTTSLYAFTREARCV